MHELFYHVNARGSIPVENWSYNVAIGRGPVPRRFTRVADGDITKNESSPLRRMECVLLFFRDNSTTGRSCQKSCDCYSRPKETLP